jgi:hypothetical protein
MLALIFCSVRIRVIDRLFTDAARSPYRRTVPRA